MTIGLIVAAMLSGCGGFHFMQGGELVATSQDETAPVRLAGTFEHAIYGHDDQDNLTVVLFDGDLDKPTQAAVIRMFWMPQAGATPVSESATNANVHYVIFARGDRDPREVGVYSGAGFLYPRSDPGQASLSFELWEASIQLADRSDNFSDLLGQSVLKGEVTAHRDESRVSKLLHQLNSDVNESLGYPRVVERFSPQEELRLTKRIGNP
jgi:hypothetical protein